LDTPALHRAISCLPSPQNYCCLSFPLTLAVVAIPIVFVRRLHANAAHHSHMPTQLHPASPAHSQPPSHSVYAESPLRNVQLQSDIVTARRRNMNLRPTASDHVARRNYGSILQSTIYDALGSSAPVDLLPHISRRDASPYRKSSDASLNENLPQPPTAEDATPETSPTHTAQPPMQGGRRVHRSPHNGAWVLDEALYATPPGCGEAPSATYGIAKLGGR
jgi:hypothetical protein